MHDNSQENTIHSGIVGDNQSDCIKEPLLPSYSQSFPSYNVYDGLLSTHDWSNVTSSAVSSASFGANFPVFSSYGPLNVFSNNATYPNLSAITPLMPLSNSQLMSYGPLISSTNSSISIPSLTHAINTYNTNTISSLTVLDDNLKTHSNSIISPVMAYSSMSRPSSIKQKKPYKKRNCYDTIANEKRLESFSVSSPKIFQKNISLTNTHNETSTAFEFREVKKEEYGGDPSTSGGAPYASYNSTTATGGGARGTGDIYGGSAASGCDPNFFNAAAVAAVAGTGAYSLTSHGNNGLTTGFGTSSALDLDDDMKRIKDRILKHPIFPFVTIMYQKCELATSTSRDAAKNVVGEPSASICSALSYADDFNEFLQALSCSDLEYKSDPEVDSMMISAVQVFHGQLQELEKVHELCDNFCERYVKTLKSKMPMDLIVDDQRGTMTPHQGQQNQQKGQSSQQSQQTLHPNNNVQQQPQQQFDIAQDATVSTSKESPALDSGYGSMPLSYGVCYDVQSVPLSETGFVAATLMQHHDLAQCSSSSSCDVALTSTSHHDEFGLSHDPAYQCHGQLQLQQQNHSSNHSSRSCQINEGNSKTNEISITKNLDNFNFNNNFRKNYKKMANDDIFCNQHNDRSALKNVDIEFDILSEKTYQNSNNINGNDQDSVTTNSEDENDCVERRYDNGSNAGSEVDYDNGKKKKVPKVFSKEAITKFRSWLFHNLTHPYPTEEQKRQLAQDTGLTMLQVNNWFINARRRIVQPMIDQNNRNGRAPNVNVFKNRRRKDSAHTLPDEEQSPESSAPSLSAYTPPSKVAASVMSAQLLNGGIVNGGPQLSGAPPSLDAATVAAASMLAGNSYVATNCFPSIPTTPFAPFMPSAGSMINVLYGNASLPPASSHTGWFDASAILSGGIPPTVSSADNITNALID